MLRKILFACAFMLINTVTLWAQQETIEVFPSAPYDRHIIFQCLAFFWMAIIGLVVIVRMKLKEIERIQKMGIDRENKDIPLLD
jgi:hypothetical protein